MSSPAPRLQEQVNTAVEAILSGGTIVFPTETIWGLGCDATSDTAVQDLYQIKRRNLSKKLISLIAEPKDIFQYVSNPPPDILDIISSFDRPTSMIFEDVIGLSPLVMEDGSAALRIASTDFTKSVIKQSGRALVTSSANRSGDDFPTHYEQIDPGLLEEVAMVVDPTLAPADMTAQPSDLVRLDADGSITYLRSF